MRYRKGYEHTSRKIKTVLHNKGMDGKLLTSNAIYGYKVYLQPKYFVAHENLAEHECDLIQGYYFAKPMPVEEFEMKVDEDGLMAYRKECNFLKCPIFCICYAK